MTAIAQLQVNLFCAGVDACPRSYGALGLAEAFRAPSSGPVERVEVEAAGMRIGLTSAQVANVLVNLGVAPASSPSTEIVLRSDNTGEIYQRAIAAGATSVVAPTDSPDCRRQPKLNRPPIVLNNRAPAELFTALLASNHPPVSRR